MARPSPDIKAIFNEALEIDSPDERAAYLDRACDGQPEVRARVEALLAALGEAGGFLEAPAATPAPAEGPATVVAGTNPPPVEPSGDPTLDHSTGPDADPTVVAARPISEGIGTQIGPYKLREKIGEGGMGVVYLAEQTQPVRRKVALKIIKPGMDTEQVVARFEAERQALALMDHPSIARVLDAGATETGRPFFVMELVKGVPITEYCDTVHLTPKERLELFIPVCAAVQHAHQKGIIHRDIKPSNVLVAMQDGKPVPKVIDFGIAKATEQRLTERSLFTQHGAIVGTLEYMSPEQAEMSAMDVDTRTDVYALGVMLYELLTGTTPLERARLRESGYAEILKRIKEEEPPKPSTRLSESGASLASVAAQRKTEPSRLAKLVRGDLDWIVMKSLEKDRTRRYETANGFARDIRRYLDGDAVEACPPSARYKLRKFARKHRGALATAGAFALLLVAASAISVGLAVWANRERIRAVRAEDAAKLQKTRAEEREAMAIDAVKRFRDAVAGEPELKNSPALDGLRKRLLKEPLAFFRALRDRLQADGDTQIESLSELAMASFDLSRLLQEIGDKSDALAACREALAIVRRIAAADPSLTKARDNLSILLNNIGILLENLGRTDEAVESYQESLKIAREMAEAHPDEPIRGLDVASGLMNLALTLDRTDRSTEAMKINREALAIVEGLAAKLPRDRDVRGLRANLKNNLALQLGHIGQMDEAMQAHRESLAGRRERAEAEPTVVKFQDDLAAAHMNIAAHLSDMGHHKEAMEEDREALAIARKLAEAHPTDTGIQVLLASVYYNLGSHLDDLGRPDEAIEAHRSALVIRRKLADGNPAVPTFQADLATSQNSIGHLLLMTGQPDEAEALERETMAIRRRLAADHPEITKFREELLTSLGQSADKLAKSGHRDEAVRVYREALKVAEELARANPTAIESRRAVARYLGNVGITLRDSGHPDEAREAEQAELVIRRDLMKLESATPYDACALGGVLNNLSVLDMDAGRFEEGRSLLREAVGWQRKALDSNPANPTYRQFMKNHQTNLIRAAKGLNDPEGVAEAEREIARLDETDPARIALDARMAALIKSGRPPRDAAEGIRLGYRAYQKGLHASAARFLGRAIEADPKLADDRSGLHRYNAACCASLAGSAAGKDDPAPDAAARAGLRRQALDWLRAELSALDRIAATAEPGKAEGVAATLRHWKGDNDLAGLRDEGQLARLPEDERAAFRKLWEDVDALLARTATHE